jgi:hypothetical protein
MRLLGYGLCEETQYSRGGPSLSDSLPTLAALAGEG